MSLWGFCKCLQNNTNKCLLNDLLSFSKNAGYLFSGKSNAYLCDKWLVLTSVSVSHTKTLVSWILAVKLCFERYLFHPWKTSQTLRSKQEGQTFLLFFWSETERRRSRRKYLWLQEEQTLSISATVYVCVYARACGVCVCVEGGVIAEGRKSKGRENNTGYSLHSLPWWFSQAGFSAEMRHALLRVSPSFVFSPSLYISFRFFSALYVPCVHNFHLNVSVSLFLSVPQEKRTEAVSAYSGLQHVRKGCLCL